MFKKIINKIIMGTKCYLMLKSACEQKENKIKSLEDSIKSIDILTSKIVSGILIVE